MGAGDSNRAPQQNERPALWCLTACSVEVILKGFTVPTYAPGAATQFASSTSPSCWKEKGFSWIAGQQDMLDPASQPGQRTQDTGPACLSFFFF
jgi:hypothetical protein